jgi:glutathione S-transferase
MKFYDCKTAPSPRRVRIFISEKNIEVDTIEVDLAAREQLGEAFRKINPDCTVPVLELDDGTRLTEVFAICQYLDDVFPESSLMGSSTVERAMVTMWNTKIEQQGLLALGDYLRNFAKGLKDRALTGPDDYEQIPELVDRGRRRFDVFMRKMEQHLADKTYVVCDAFSIADISLLVAIDFAARTKIAMEDEMVNLRRWHELISARPGSQV